MPKKRKPAYQKKYSHPGQPTKYTPDNLAKIFLLTRRGFSDEEIGRVMDMTKGTVYLARKLPEYSLPLKCSKKLSDLIVERSLYERAIGYSCPEDHITNYQGQITITPTVKHYPPDVTAQIFWLKNRQPDVWRDVSEFRGELKIELSEVLQNARSRLLNYAKIKNTETVEATESRLN